VDLEYRLRIRDASTLANPDGTTDALTITSVAGGTNPYISEPPSGDGQEVNPITGAVREGSYSVRVIDPITGTDGTGTLRLITNQLEDAGYRQQLLSRRCYVEYRQNGGAWATLTAGYLSALRLVTAIEYEFSISDSRRIGRTRKIFASGLPTWASRGAIIGGPMITGSGVGSAFLGIKNRGGWQFRVTAVTGREISCEFVNGYAGPTGKTTTKIVEALAASGPKGPNSVTDITGKYRTDERYTEDNATVTYSAYNALRLYVVGNAGTHIPRESYWDGDAGVSHLIGAYKSFPSLSFWWDTVGGGAVPSVGDVLTVHLYVDAVTEDSPMYVDMHPVDLLTQLWTDARISYDAATAATVKARIGADVRLALRITAPQNLNEFLQEAIFGPFGFSARMNASGQLECFTTRLKDTGTPAYTIASTDLRSAEPVAFDIAEETVVTAVTLSHQVYTIAPDSTPERPQPRDGVLFATQRVTNASADTTAFGTKEVSLDIPGMVHLATSLEADLSALVAATALEVFDRFGRGASSGEFELLATAAAAAAKIGEEIYVTAPHYPNKNYRIGESSVGARIMQLVRRTESPAGPVFKLVDSGLAQQPIAPAATISIAASSADARTIAQFTITNAAAINAATVLGVAVEWATGAGSPAGNGQLFKRYAAASCPTGAVPLPPVDAGAKVWVRARTEQDGRRPSAWTAWTSVTLTALSAPAALTVSNIKQTAATLSWTNGSATDDTEVFVYLGGAPPADWAPYKVARLRAGSTRTIVRSLSGPAITYQVAVCHVDAGGTRSAMATSSVVTNGTLDGCPRPAGFSVLANRENAEGRTGIALALWAADTTIDIAIERAPDVAGVPGAWVEITRVPGTTSVYVDDLPSNGLTYWYRIRHSLGGLGDSSYTAEQSGTPGAIPDGLVRPDPIAPIIEVSDTESGTTGTTTLTITDPQGRVTLVEFRTQTDPGAWSGWVADGSVPYSTTVTIPTGSGQWGRIGYRVTGYDGLGVERVLATGTEIFDLNQVSNLVVIDVSFSHDGSAIVKVTGDSDTKSIRMAVSTSAYPSSATVGAAAAVNGRQVETTFTGPFNVGTTLYCSAIGYSGLAGAGTASDKMDFKMIREGQDVRVQEKTSETGTTGTVQLVVTDPNSRISSYEYRTMVGRGAWSGWAAMTNTAPNTYEASVSLIEKVPSKIGWRIIGTSLTGQIGVGLFENVVTFTMGPVPMEPVIEATVREDGKVDVSVIGDTDTASLQVGFSTVSQAAADAALGSTVNARQTTFSNIGTLTLGQRAYISVKAWSGTGASGSGSIIAQTNIIYSSTLGTKYLNLSAGGMTPYASNTTIGRTNSAVYVTNAGPVSGQLVAEFDLPEGCTITNFQADLYDDGTAGSRATARLDRADATGGISTLGSVTAGGSGWQSLTVGLSESTTSRRYQVIITLANTAILATAEQAAGVVITYDTPNIFRTK
jgi:hypothetical protein